MVPQYQHYNGTFLGRFGLVLEKSIGERDFSTFIGGGILKRTKLAQLVRKGLYDICSNNAARSYPIGVAGCVPMLLTVSDSPTNRVHYYLPSSIIT